MENREVGIDVFRLIAFLAIVTLHTAGQPNGTAIPIIIDHSARDLNGPLVIIDRCTVKPQFPK